jgi:hypothetical protein
VSEDVWCERGKKVVGEATMKTKEKERNRCKSFERKDNRRK